MQQGTLPAVDIEDLPSTEELLTVDDGTAPFIYFSQEPLQGAVLQHLMAR